MRRIGIGLLVLGMVGVLLVPRASQAASPSGVGISVGVATVGHPPGPPHGRYGHHPPVHRPPRVVLPPPPPPPPPRCIYRPYVYYYYPTPSYYYSYDTPGGSFYYYTPRGGFSITW